MVFSSGLVLSASFASAATATFLFQTSNVANLQALIMDASSIRLLQTNSFLLPFGPRSSPNYVCNHCSITRNPKKPLSYQPPSCIVSNSQLSTPLSLHEHSLLLAKSFHLLAHTHVIAKVSNIHHEVAFTIAILAVTEYILSPFFVKMFYIFQMPNYRQLSQYNRKICFIYVYYITYLVL